jgi:hypothetical protein
MLAATLIGLPAGLTFVGLRLETAVGGLAGWTLGRPTPSFASPVMCTLLGLAAGTGVRWAGLDFTAAIFVSNLFVVLTYGMVGWYLADYQVRRHAAEGVWSLSGVSLSGVFSPAPSCT